MKNKILLSLLLISVFLIFVSCKPAQKESVTVFEDGKTEYTIVTVSDASDDEKNLAEKLYEIAGSVGELLTDETAEKRCEILIGETNRGTSDKYSKKLANVSSATYFHYIVAEEDGKIVIISDSDIGYVYALEYLEANYIKDGSFVIPSGTYELRKVLWDSYYATDLYLERITAEADKNRYESDKNLIENEKNKYDNDNGNSIITVAQAIEQYKSKLASFDTTLFGDYTSTIFTSANIYREPTVRPDKNAHPRILFTDNSIDSVKQSLTANESRTAYNKMIALSDAPCDGIFKALTGNQTQNYNADTTARIEAKAFRYAMTGESIYGYEALYAIKNAILTIDVKHTVGDWCRTYGHLMYVLGCVYDWCYDLMTEEDKAQLIAGGVNLLGMHLEVVCFVNSTNKVPTAQGTIYGHGAEDQILVDYLSFAIACYDEAPEIYELVGGRVLNDYVEAQNFLFQSGTAWEGSMYGSVRTVATLLANLLINKMTDGEVTPFEKVEDAVVASSYWIRPDGQVYRIGDINENSTSFQFVWFANNCFYAGNLYNNPYLKSIAYSKLSKFSYFSNMVAGLSAVQFLAVNDPDVSHTYEDGSPLVYTARYPSTSLFAKSANGDKNAFGIYMTMPENYASSHAHMECGSFQIYYKGALATDSGAYDSWGGTHHMGYNMQTISSNSLLIYNPSLKDYRDPIRSNMFYSGGQSIANGANLPNTLDELLKHPALGQCTSLGVANVEKNGKYLYSYMAGDMTGAYDEETVDEVSRYMFAVATGIAKCPYAVIIFDRITSDDPSYRKSALIHVQNEPTITDDGFAIITNGDGKLVVQSVMADTEYTVIGGEGKEFWIPGVDENGNYSLEDGKNIPTNIQSIPGSIEEYGWGRIEISPAEEEKTSYMLTVMYVTDAQNNSVPTRADDISSDNLAGAMLFGKAVLFPKNEKLLTEESSFTLSSGGECFVTGVSEGTWNITSGGNTVTTVVVEEGTNMFSFNAKNAGTYTITPAS